MGTTSVNNINQFNIAKSSTRPLVTTFQDLSVEGKKAYHASSNLNFTARMEGAPNALIGVSEGDSWFDYPLHDVLSLLEENARLRGLVIKLSNLVLKNVAEQR